PRPAGALVVLRLGAPVDFVVAGAANPFTGTVQRINPVADPTTRQVEIHVALLNEGGRLVSGLYAEGRVSTAVRDALAVPAAAIDRSLGTPALLRVANGRVERVPVQLGIADSNSEKVEVLSGVVQGDLVLLGAARAITPGAKVIVQNAPVPAAKPAREANGA